MRCDLPTPRDGAVFYEDKKAYAALANYPVAPGHAVVVWKKHVTDLHLLRKADYEHLMTVVDLTRNALLRALKLKKVYLIYMDEANHVHWHLVPRYTIKGVNALREKPAKSIDLTLANTLRKLMNLSG